VRRCVVAGFLKSPRRPKGTGFPVPLVVWARMPVESIEKVGYQTGTELLHRCLLRRRGPDNPTANAIEGAPAGCSNSGLCNPCSSYRYGAKGQFVLPSGQKSPRAQDGGVRKRQKRMRGGVSGTKPAPEKGENRSARSVTVGRFGSAPGVERPLGEGVSSTFLDGASTSLDVV